MSNYSLTLEREKFSKMLNLMKLIENHCTDCDIQNGKIRQRTNNRQCVIDIDLSTILSDNHLSLSLVKNKAMLLKSFDLDDNVQLDNKNILIEANDSNYEFTDPISKMVFRKPLPKFLDNTFIVDDEFEQIITSKCKEENSLFSYTISNYIRKRMVSACLGFDIDLITFKLNEFKGSASVVPTNKENMSTFIDEITLNKEVSSSYFLLINLPFTLDVASDLVVDCYIIKKDVYLCKVTQTYYGVPIIIYNQVQVKT